MDIEQVKDIGELELRVRDYSQKSHAGDIFITTSIHEEIPTSIQLPMLYSYSSRIDVQTDSKTFFYREDSEDCPDDELIRSSAKAHSLELGLLAAKIFESAFPRKKVKVDELSVNQAERLLQLYTEEFERVKKEHEGYIYE